MSLDCSGGESTVKSGTVSINVSAEHPLLKLANALPWTLLIAVVVEDLKRTTPKGSWWTGRKLYVRLHLAVFLLQKIYDLTDRSAEYGLKDNAAYQLFCGKGLILPWHAPDHTKIAAFRGRLSPETQRLVANETAKVAVKLGFADASAVDFDSTVQEANISYPADANLMTKLAGLGRKVIDYLKAKTRGLIPDDLTVDMKAVKEKARKYFFMPKNTDIETRRAVFKELHRFLKQQMRPVVDLCSGLDARRVANLPWNIRRAADQIRADAWRYLLDVGHFTRKHTIKAGKILALHVREVACIRKGKVGKDMEFGRVFQLGRLKGNFLFVLASTSLRMDDKQSFIPLVEEHAKIFGDGSLKSVAADKGYWQAKNQRELTQRGITESGLQRPGNVQSTQGMSCKEVHERLKDRRAGIEPLIGHAKHGGQLGRSRMKSDAATLAAGYGAVLGLNLRQLIRHQGGKIKMAA